jgi:C4-dicarboxylate transporter
MLSQPIPLYLKQAFELLWSNHPYVDLFNHVFYPSLSSMMLLSEWIYLWKLSMTIKRLLWLSMWFLQYKLWYKGFDRNISTICLLFSNQEQRFAITNHDLPCAPLLWLLCSLQVKLYKGKSLSIMTCVLVSVMLLVRILFIDTSLHKHVVIFTKFSFRLGTSKV